MRKRTAKFANVLTKKYLKEEYIQNRKNTNEIANIIGCSGRTVCLYLEKNQIQARDIKKKNNPNWIDGKWYKNYSCKELGCNNRICSITYFKGQGRCNSCANKGKRNGMFGKTGKLAPSYIHGQGYKPYSTKFNKELKLQIRERDNYTCQGENCNMTEEEHIIIYGRVLEVHHIDYDKENCREENLISLCKQCNIRANYNRYYWMEYFKEINNA